MKADESDVERPAWTKEPWRREILDRLTADVDPQIWEWMSEGATVSPKRRAAYALADVNFTKAANVARALAAELGSNNAPSDRGRRLALDLHESLGDALHKANVGERQPAGHGTDDDPHVVLVVLRMGLDLGDLLPPLAKALRVSAVEGKPIESMSMARRLALLPTTTWASESGKFERLANALERVALEFRSFVGPKPAAKRPSIGNWKTVIQRAGEKKIKPYELAKMLARLGMATSIVDVAHRPSPMDAELKPADPRTPWELRPRLRRPRYRTEAEFVAAHEAWVKEQADRHFQRLRQVGRQKKSRVGKS